MRLCVLAVLEDEQTAPLYARLIGPKFDLEPCRPDTLGQKLDDLPVAAVVCDCQVGDTNGVQLLSTVTAHMPAVRRVLVVRGDQPLEIDGALERGVIHYVLRSPLHRDEVRRALAVLLDSFDRVAASELMIGTLQELSRSEPPTNETLARLDRLSREIELSGFRDPATGLYIWRSFQERLREEVARARRYKRPLSVIYLDVDNFGQINETYGYAAGDQVIATVASVLREDGDHNRESDIAARMGGQEFALLLPETDAAGGRVKAERLREALSASDYGGLSITASFGVATFPADADGPVELLGAAMNAQSEAKAAGKNRVQPASSEPDSEPEPRAEFTYYHGHLDEITRNLERDLSVSCLFVDLSQLRRVEREFGVSAHAELFARAGELLSDTRGECLRRDDRLFRTEDADGYLCFLSPPRDDRGIPAPLDLDSIARRVQKYLVRGLSSAMEQLTAEPPRFVVGYARVLANPMARSERLILKVIADARASAELVRQRNALRDKATLQDIILRRQLNPVYQPIVQLESGEIFGFEALTRGPAQSGLESPLALFGIADEVDLTFELDRACFRNGLRGAAGLSPVHRLFVNLLPQSFYDTRFIESEVERLLDGAGLTPANVVFEITERLAIENFTAFRRALATYTAMGFGVAIDDVGTRHSNLETVMALRPHFIKVSDILTRGVSRSTVKREMLRSLQRIAAAIDAVIVAEGIEELADVEVLGKLGIRYGQGFHLARPGPAFPELTHERQLEIRALADQRSARPRRHLRVQPDVDELETGTFVALGNGSGEHPAFDDDLELANGSMSGLDPLEEKGPGEDTSPKIVMPAEEPWRPLSAEELGRPAGGASLLDALRDPLEAKKSLN